MPIKFIFFYVLVTTSLCWGQEETSPPSPGLIKRTGQVLKKSHENFSETIYDFSTSIDEFFANPRIDAESNESRLRLNLLSQFTDREDEKYEASVNFHLDLPKTQKKWNFILISLSKDLTEGDEEASEGSTPVEGIQNQDYFAGLRYFIQDNKNFNISSDAGVKLVWPPDPFAKIRARESVAYKNWEYRFTQTLFWFNSRGIGIDIDVDFDRPLRKGLLFRFANGAAWLKDEPATQFSHSLNLFQTLTKRDGLAYSTGISSEAEPTPVIQTYTTTVRYRRDLYAKYLYGEIQPIVQWPRKKNFVFTPGIIFRIELLFGG